MSAMGGKLTLHTKLVRQIVPSMWRTFLSVLLAAVLGSALATTIYALWMSFWQGGSPGPLGVGILVALVALWFTIPGAFVLAASEAILSRRIRTDRALNGSVIALGVCTGGAVLGGLTKQSDLALVGGFYGFITAVLFVLFQQQFGFRRRRSMSAIGGKLPHFSP